MKTEFERENLWAKRIIGFSGKIGAGKDTAAVGIIREFGYQYVKVICFSDFLKAIMGMLFDIRITPDQKNKDMLVGESKMTVRELLQYVGTDVMRGIDPDCWIRPYLQAVEAASASMIVTPDVRFPNEVEAIKEHGGIVIRLLRGIPDLLAKKVKRHSSETALDGYGGFTEVLDNRNMDILTQWNAVSEIIKKHHCWPQTAV